MIICTIGFYHSRLQLSNCIFIYVRPLCERNVIHNTYWLQSKWIGCEGKNVVVTSDTLGLLFFFLLSDRIFVFRNTFSKRTNSFATHRFWFYAYLFRELFDLFSFWSNKKFELFMILSALRSKISFFIYSFVSASALTWTLTKKLLHTHEIGFGIGFSI